MGSYIEINDTLQVSKAQGFPAELEISKHLEKNYNADDFKDQIFKFSNKPSIRLYHQPPVRVFLVENIDGKWLYWGLVHIISVAHNYLDKTTSGEFKITYINTPEEMKKAHNLIDRNPDTSYFG